MGAAPRQRAPAPVLSVPPSHSAPKGAGLPLPERSAGGDIVTWHKWGVCCCPHCHPDSALPGMRQGCLKPPHIAAVFPKKVAPAFPSPLGQVGSLCRAIIPTARAAAATLWGKPHGKLAATQKPSRSPLPGKGLCRDMSWRPRALGPTPHITAPPHEEAP